MNKKEVPYVLNCRLCYVYQERAGRLNLLAQQCSCGLLYRYSHGRWVLQYRGHKTAIHMRIGKKVGFKLK